MRKTRPAANAAPDSASFDEASDPSGRSTQVVEVYDPVARARWAQRLQVSQERLMEAVRFVGVELQSVRLYLSERQAGDR